METLLQGQNRVVWRAWCLIVHAGAQLLWSRLGIHTTILADGVVHHGDFECALVGTSAAHGGSNAIHAWWSHCHEGLLIDVSLLLDRVDADAGPCGDNCRHEVTLSSLKQGRVVVTKRVGADGTENVEELVAIGIHNDISLAGAQVYREVRRQSAVQVAHSLFVFDCFWSWERCLYLRGGLVWECTSACREEACLSQTVVGCEELLSCLREEHYCF